MNRSFMVYAVVPVLLVLSASGTSGQDTKASVSTLRLDSVNGLELVDAKAEVVNYRGRSAVHLVPLPNQPKDYSMLAIVSGTDFKKDTIEIEDAGSPGKDAHPGD